jgi:transposase
MENTNLALAEPMAPPLEAAAGPALAPTPGRDDGCNHCPDPDLPGQAADSAPVPRLRRIDRSRSLPPLPLDQLLEPDHRARLVWQLSGELDFSPWLADIKAVEGQPGRNATDPRLLFCLWLLATLDGVTSARYLDELCTDRLPYLWLLGGVTVNYETLGHFRVSHPEYLQTLLTDSVAAMLAEDLISLEMTAQDGLRIRASAGAGSFRRRASLEQSRQQAQEYLTQLQQQPDEDSSPRQRAARLRGARERLERLEGALSHLEELEQKRAELRADQVATRGQREPRASTTDPAARRMKMPDGGTRPAFNAQINSTVQGDVIVNVDLINAGNDYGQIEPMLEQCQRDYDQVPQGHLVDGGFASLEEIAGVAQRYPQTQLYAPVKDAAKQEAEGKTPYEPKKGDKPGVAAWRQRMGTQSAKETYKWRAATAELVNAQMRNRGLYQVRVRGLAKVKAVLLWYALAHNLTRWAALRQAALAKNS